MKMNTKSFRTLLGSAALACLLAGGIASAGVLDPECTPEKAVKGAAANAAIGVGGRCKPGETVKDTTKNAVGIDDDKKHRGDGPINKATDKVKKD
jgi:hypothetical protein